MLSNSDFLRVITNSFEEFLSSGTSRSTAKLKPLHGAIAHDLAERLGTEYQVFSQGYGNGKEASIHGRYIDKMVDIAVKKGDAMVAGVGVKFLMQNYSQNSNNYFENMLGETANIRCANYPYFQIFIILDKLPYYNRKKRIIRWETFTDHNVEKYAALAQDNPDRYLHTPNKTLLYVVHIPDNENLQTLDEYLRYYKDLDFHLQLSKHPYSAFSNVVILNDYGTFIEKVYYTILAF